MYELIIWNLSIFVTTSQIAYPDYMLWELHIHIRNLNRIFSDKLENGKDRTFDLFFKRINLHYERTYYK